MELKLYIERMQEGQKESFSGQIPSTELFTPEPELIFSPTISVEGEAYLAGDHLILKIEASTTAQMPCSICNELVEIPLHLSDFTHAEPLESIKTGVFDFTPLIREDLLLELPLFVECEGRCPQRESMHKYFKSENKTQFPFSDLKNL